MDTFDIPIFKKSYDLYKTLYRFRRLIPKQDRYALWQRCENTTLDLLEHILAASQTQKSKKLAALEEASSNINVLRILIRLAKETRAIDAKKYLSVQTNIDEIGRMLGGWIRASRFAANNTQQTPEFERLSR